MEHPKTQFMRLFGTFNLKKIHKKMGISASVPLISFFYGSGLVRLI
jgi:hypothetical protein